MTAIAQVRFITSSFSIALWRTLVPAASERAHDQERAEECPDSGRDADANRRGPGARPAVQWLDLELLEPIERQVAHRLRHARARLHGDPGAVDDEQRRPETIAVAGA